jgi:hypothetical protein
MRTSRLNTFAGGWPMRIGATLAVMMALALTACGTADYVTDSQASVLLIIASINEGAQLDSDVRNGEFSTFVCEDEVPVEVAVRNKNPNAPTPRIPGAVLLNRYNVHYFRSDGHNVEGVDVPYQISGTLSAALDVATSGTNEIPIEVVRRQAKLEPPLTNIFQVALLTVQAEITLYGETVAGDKVSASGLLQIDFADYGDTEEECPAS